MVANTNDMNKFSRTAQLVRIKDAMRKWRAARNLSQADAASLLGIPRRNYEKYEGDANRGIPMPIVGKFCALADVDANWLLSGQKKQRIIPIPALAKIEKKIKSVA